jgi:Spy/CpxP family protein refolding chaperone
MKKLLMVAFLVVGLTAFAQEKKMDRKRADIEKLTPEQRNQLAIKKMTLELGLNDSQQKEMSKIIAEQSAKREAVMAERKANREKGVKPTADERFARESKRLDEQMAMQERVKKILSPEQFKKWEQLKADRKEKMQERREKRGDKMPKPE